MQRLPSTNSFFSIIIAHYIGFKHTLSKAIGMADLVISARCNDRRVNYIRELKRNVFSLFSVLQECIGSTEKLVNLFCSFQLFGNMKTVDITAILNMQLLQNNQ